MAAPMGLFNAAACFLDGRSGMAAETMEELL